MLIDRYQILPGTGRGTMCNMVEGARAEIPLRQGYALPPPHSGEDFSG